MRIAIAGGPRVGKTTLAESLAITPVWATDWLMGKGTWEAQVAEVVSWLSSPPSWVVEGVLVAEALSAWCRANEGTPCDTVLWRNTPHVPRTHHQHELARACERTWRRLRPTLEARGVVVRKF